MQRTNDCSNKEDDSEEDIHTTKFLELLLRYGYVSILDFEKSFKLTLVESDTHQFLKECREFLQDPSEEEVAKKLLTIRDHYMEELQKTSENREDSRLPWFSLADKLFQGKSMPTSDETPISSPVRDMAVSQKSMSVSQPLMQDMSPSVHGVESVLVTGANRGIGLEFVKQLVNLPNPPRFVFATFRDESTTQTLKEIRDGCQDTQVVLVKMDITKPHEIESARKAIEEKLGDKGLNLVINNAAALKMQGFPDITEENLLLHFSTNTVGPVNVVKEMLPLLQKAAAQKSGGMSASRAAAQKSGGMSASRAAVLNISAMGGSITKLDDSQPRIFLSAMGYRISKTALNMAMRVISLTVKDQGILIVSMCPGWVKTDMGSDRALLTVEESISSMLETLSKLNEDHQGTFMDRNGVISEF